MIERVRTSTRCCRRPSARAAVTRVACPMPKRSRAAKPTSTSARPAARRRIVALAALTGRPTRAAQSRQRPRSRAHRGVHRRRTLHRLHQVPAALPGGCDHRRAAAHAHRHRGAVHGLRAVRRALPGRLHHHDPAAGEPVAVARAAARRRTRARATTRTTNASRAAPRERAATLAAKKRGARPAP